MKPMRVILALGMILTGAFMKSQAITNNSYLWNVPNALSSDFRLSLSVEMDQVSRSILLKWSLKNESKVDAQVSAIRPLADYQIEITNEQGKRISLTEKGLQELLLASFISHRGSVKLRPGEELKDQLNISDMYEMKAGNRYSITIRRTVPKQGGGWSKVVSNKVKVVIK